MAKSIDMTSGNLWKQIAVFSLPLILSNVLQILFNMADVAVIGQLCGSDSLGAVGSTSILITLFTGFCIGVGNGVNAVTARYIGAKDSDNLKKTVHTAFLLALIIGLCVAGISIATSKPILKLIGTNEDLMEKALLYIRVYLLGMPGLALFNYGNAIYSAKGNTRVPLVFLIIAGLVNVALNIFFVQVFQMDVLGVAVASVIAQYLSAFLVLLGVARMKDDCHLSFSHLRMDAQRSREVLLIALPSGFQAAIFAIANLFIQSGVNQFDKTMIAGNTAATNADSLIYDIMAAVYMGCSSFLSQNLGAKNKKRMMQSYLITTLYSFGVAALYGGAMLLFGKYFLRIFSSDEAVVEAGMKKLVIMSFSYCVSAFMDNSLAASRGLGKTLIPTIIVILGSCVFRVVWVYTVFAYYHTIPSLYLLYIFSWTITGASEVIYFLYSYKKATVSY